MVSSSARGNKSHEEHVMELIAEHDFLEFCGILLRENEGRSGKQYECALDLFFGSPFCALILSALLKSDEKFHSERRPTHSSGV